MFQAIEEASRRCGQRIHFAMVGWFPDRMSGRGQYEEAARLHAPSIPLHILNGNDVGVVDEMWAAADIFMSLVDNIQETFGMTIIESMAAGLPIVASDWDGYRATIQHGKQGFLVPTLLGPVGLGNGMLLRHVLGLDPYQRYVGTVAQHTAVNVAKAAEALATLIAQPELRRQMGESGRERVRRAYDWPVVVGQLMEVIENLSEIRSGASTFEGRGSQWKHNPVNRDPFSTFMPFASGSLNNACILRNAAQHQLDPASAFQSAELNRFGTQWRATADEVELIYKLVCDAGELTVGEVLRNFPVHRTMPLQASVIWMCKLGILDWDCNWPVQ
jgi:hypothetical protein